MKQRTVAWFPMQWHLWLRDNPKMEANGCYICEHFDALWDKNKAWNPLRTSSEITGVKIRDNVGGLVLLEIIMQATVPFLATPGQIICQ